MVDGVTAGPMPRMHSEMTPTEVLRSMASLPLTYFETGFSNIFQSWAKDPPSAMARLATTSSAVSMVSQSYSEVSSSEPRSSPSS